MTRLNKEIEGQYLCGDPRPLVSKLSEMLSMAHSTSDKKDRHLRQYHIICASWDDSVFSLMLFGYSPKEIEWMACCGVKEQDLSRLKLPGIVQDFILSRKHSSWHEATPQINRAFSGWAWRYRQKNKLVGSNIYDFVLARAKVINEEKVSLEKLIMETSA